MRILKEDRVFDQFLKIDKAIIKTVDEKGNSVEYSRLKLNRRDAAGILLFNRDKETIVLVRQFRYPLYQKIDEPILEIPAGIIDEGETEYEAIVREVEEECGYRVKENCIEKITSFFPAAGYATEEFFLFFAEVSDKDKISEGGGNIEEHENIEVLEIPLVEFLRLHDHGQLRDSKTLIAAFYARRVIRQ